MCVATTQPSLLVYGLGLLVWRRGLDHDHDGGGAVVAGAAADDARRRVREGDPRAAKGPARLDRSAQRDAGDDHVVRRVVLVDRHSGPMKGAPSRLLLGGELGEVAADAVVVVAGRGRASSGGAGRGRASSGGGTPQALVEDGVDGAPLGGGQPDGEGVTQRLQLHALEVQAPARGGRRRQGGRPGSEIEQLREIIVHRSRQRKGDSGGGGRNDWRGGDSNGDDRRGGDSNGDDRRGEEQRRRDGGDHRLHPPLRDEPQPEPGLLGVRHVTRVDQLPRHGDEDGVGRRVVEANEPAALPQ
jgi:hypothetical protein